MFIRSRAPLRIGMAGGGTDVSPYSDMFGGAVLNATISMYAYATIEPRDDGRICFESVDQSVSYQYESSPFLAPDGQMDLVKAAYNRIVNDFCNKPLSFKIWTYVDAPPGSGLGSSSTLVAAVVGAFVEWLNLPLGEYDIAALAYQIERKDMMMAGGKQDQFAATFGGFNFMEFYADDKVIVNPLRIRPETINELEFCFLLYYTRTSRLSSTIIEAQSRNVLEKREESIEAMHNLKQQAIMMKESILKGHLHDIGEILDYGWRNKKQMALGISNELIDSIYESARNAGSTGGKVSGAGGGGFFIFFCPGESRYKVIEALRQFGGEFRRFQFTKKGLTSWKA